MSTAPFRNIFRAPSASIQTTANRPPSSGVLEAQENVGNNNNQTGSINEWLDSKGLGKYCEHFVKAGVDLSLLPCLTETDLKESLGIVAVGARKKIVLCAKELQGRNEGDRNANAAAALAKTHGIAAYFPGGLDIKKAKNPDGTIDAYLPHTKRSIGQNAPSGTAPKKSKSTWVHDNVRKEEAGKGGGAQKQRWNGSRKSQTPFKSWQVIPGCPGFVVDRFDSLPSALSQYNHWFLTHFHADHYKGLTSKFNHGTIYCSPITSALIRQQLRVPASIIQEIPLNVPTMIQGVKVTFIDANHCPGAIMIVFEPPGRQPVLHTGDCRLVARMQQEPVLQQLRLKLPLLILDTTYADPQYTFPSQEDVIKFSVDACKAESFNAQKTLFMFGSYTIGKERLFLEVASTLNRPLYVSATKKKVLDCIEIPPEIQKLITTDDTTTNLHVVPMWMISQKHMKNALKFYKGRFTTIIGFKPTGWTHERDTQNTKAKLGRRQAMAKGTMVTYQVPYSEHSSFTELREFVKWFQPQRIIPHVNSDDGGPKADKLVSLLRYG